MEPDERNRFLKESLGEDPTFRTGLVELFAQSDSAEIDFSRLEQHVIQSLAELNPDEAVLLLLEMDASPHGFSSYSGNPCLSLVDARHFQFPAHAANCQNL